MALAMALNFCTSEARELKQKVRKFWGLIPTFGEVKKEELVGLLPSLVCQFSFSYKYLVILRCTSTLMIRYFKTVYQPKQRSFIHIIFIKKLKGH